MQLKLRKLPRLEGVDVTNLRQYPLLLQSLRTNVIAGEGNPAEGPQPGHNSYGPIFTIKATLTCHFPTGDVGLCLKASRNGSSSKGCRIHVIHKILEQSHCPVRYPGALR